jgi:hypothetical protein
MRERVLEYIKKYGYITTWEAFRDLGCTRLSEYIRQLRQTYNIVGEPVMTTNRYGEKTMYYKYRIVGEENDIKTII